MKKIFLFIVLFAVISLCTFPQSKSNISEKELKEYISFLASDSLKGRYTGTPEAESAAKYIMKDFKKSGLKPLFKKSYFQNFSFISSVKLAEKNYLEIDFNKARVIPKLNSKYMPASFSGNAEASGDLVFAGYGISAPELKYDDYSNIDVKGKVVIIMRYYPNPEAPHSQFEKYADYRLKAKTAKDKGAAGVIFINNSVKNDEEDRLLPLKYDGAPGIENYPVIYLKRGIINNILTEENTDLVSLQNKIDSTKEPVSFQLKFSKVKLAVSLAYDTKDAINVAGWIEGSDPKLKNEFIVIGAHYDHLGYGESGSLYRGKEKLIHYGADDNASGTAGVMELAEQFAANKKLLKRSIIFVCFAGEEEGLLGSNYFVNNSPVKNDKIVAMLNLDMVGRLNSDNSLILYGTGTSALWKDMINKTNKKYEFKLTFNDEGYGPSDQTSFYSKKIPVLFFFTGTHSDYHRPGDTAGKINYTGESKILNFVYELAESISKSIEKPVYVNIPSKDNGNTGFKVYFGTIPDFSFSGKGFKINGVNEGSPAQKAGLAAGDIVIFFGSK